MSAVIVEAAAWVRRFVPLAVLIWGLICAAATLAAPVAVVTGAAVDRGSYFTRIALDLSQPVAFNVFTLPDPHRIVIDLSDVSWRAKPVEIVGNGPCATLRHGEVRPGTWRIVLECPAATTVRQALLQNPGDGSGYRLLVELSPAPRKGVLGYMSAGVPNLGAPGTAQPAAAPPPTAKVEAAAPRSLAGDTRLASASPSLPAAARVLPEKPAASPPASREPVAATASGQPPAAVPPKAEIGATALAVPVPARRPTSPRAQRVVVLDAGHGGADPGAIGVSGIYEKDITLAAVREIKRALEQTGRYKVLLTRNDDRFIRLRDRVDFARRANADLFVSVHADSVSRRDVRGASVYTLSNMASDSEAAALAEKENKADLIAGLDLSRESTEVTNILIDLAQRETMNQSAAFASHVVDHLAGTTMLLPNPHRFAGFAVLKAPDIPSVLIELGFLSNRSDEKALQRSDNRTRVAAAVARAIDGYLNETMSASAW